MLHQRYKDGIQWHDVPFFFRSPIICEVSCPFFWHMVHKYSFFPMLSHGAHCLKVFCCIFVSLYFFCVFCLIGLWCPDGQFFVILICVYLYFFHHFCLTFTSFVLQDSDVQMARVKRERGVDVRSPVSWAGYPSHRFIRFLVVILLVFCFYLLCWCGKFWVFLSLQTLENLFSSAKRHQICSKFRTQGMRVKFCRQAKFPPSSHNFETIPLATLANLFY